jgi:hypothetical protein
MKPIRALKWGAVIAGTAIWLGLIGGVILVLIGS